MQIALFGLAFVIGVLVPVQAALNHSLKVTADSGAVFAALISFIVGTVALIAVNLASGEKWISVQKLGDASMWQFAGGLIGAMFVFGTTLLAPRIGLADMACLIIAGQILASLAFDRYGRHGDNHGARGAGIQHKELRVSRDGDGRRCRNRVNNRALSELVDTNGRGGCTARLRTSTERADINREVFSTGKDGGTGRGGLGADRTQRTLTRTGDTRKGARTRLRGYAEGRNADTGEVRPHAGSQSEAASREKSNSRYGCAIALQHF